MSPRSEPVVEIRRAGRSEIPALQPLWESLHDHHVAIAPHLRELGPVRSAAQSWAVRSALYEDWLAEPDAFVMLAEANGTPVGYALVHMRGEEESWQTGPRIAELETLTVLPGERGGGTGRRLVEAVYAELQRLGVRQLGVSVIAANADAIRFYERLGLMPFCVSYLGNIPSDSTDQSLRETGYACPSSERPPVGSAAPGSAQHPEDRGCPSRPARQSARW